MTALVAVVFVLLAVVVVASVSRGSLRRSLRRLATDHRLHLTSTDRFHLASRICVPEGVQGPIASATVRHVLYRTREHVRDFVFTYEALEGAASPRRVVRVIHARERVAEHQPACRIIAIRTPDRRIVDCYRQLVEAISTAGSEAGDSAGIESVGRD
jgi:hypothetical protein